MSKVNVYLLEVAYYVREQGWVQLHFVTDGCQPASSRPLPFQQRFAFTLSPCFKTTEDLTSPYLCVHICVSILVCPYLCVHTCMFTASNTARLKLGSPADSAMGGGGGGGGGSDPSLMMPPLGKGAAHVHPSATASAMASGGGAGGAAAEGAKAADGGGTRPSTDSDHKSSLTLSTMRVRRAN